MNVFGHCTGRLITPRSHTGKVRPQSQYDRAAVFAACAEHTVAVEINCSPHRLDPPRDLMHQALDAGCLFSIDTDAHAPGQLDWQDYGCARAVEVGIRRGPGRQHLAGRAAARVEPGQGRRLSCPRAERGRSR